MSRTFEDRLAELEAKVEVLWAGNPPHRASGAGEKPSKQEYPKQIGRGKDAVVVNSLEEERRLSTSAQPSSVQ